MSTAHVILTADEVKARLKAHRTKSAIEKREFERAQAVLENYQDLRDDVMSLVKNSRLSYEEIHNRCGPTPTTLAKWRDHEIDQPRLSKLQSTLRILGYDLGVVPGRRALQR
jgi:hypothetical protein